MDVKKDIYVELTMRAIKDGKVWQRSVGEYPGIDKAAYLAIEEAISATLIGIGHAALGPKK